jgi:phosphohistidine phosphatase SixA
MAGRGERAGESLNVSRDDPPFAWDGAGDVAGARPVKRIELLRHAPRDPDRDALSAEGRGLAAEVGASRADVRYDTVFVSPATRAAETVAWFLRGANQQLPPSHDVIPGLAGKDASGGSPEGLAAGLRSLLAGMGSGERALAISHTPFVERAAFGLTGREVEPMGELEGILITQDDAGAISVEELRLDG